MDSLVVTNASPITSGGNPWWRKRSSTKNYYAASQRTGNIRNQHNFWQPRLTHFYKGNEEKFTHQESNRKVLVTAISQPSSESNPNAFNPKINLESIKRFLNAFAKLCSPYSLIAIILSMASVSFIAVERLSDISPLFFLRVLQAIIPKMFLTIYVNGLNQIYDAEIDKINKPYNPMISGGLSFTTGVTLTVSSLIMTFWLGSMVGSWQLLWSLILVFIFWTAYSANWPLLRWKKYPALTAICYLTTWAYVCPTLDFLHIQTFVFKRTATLTRPIILFAVITGFFSIAIAFFKDIHDIEGDQAFGVQTIAARLGRKKMFWVCVSILEMAYVVGILAGASSLYLWSKIVTSIGHVALASFLLHRARSADLESNDSIMSFYMFIWKLLYAEFLLLPLLR